MPSTIHELTLVNRAVDLMEHSKALRLTLHETAVVAPTILAYELPLAVHLACVKRTFVQPATCPPAHAAPMWLAITQLALIALFGGI